MRERLCLHIGSCNNAPIQLWGVLTEGPPVRYVLEVWELGTLRTGFSLTTQEEGQQAKPNASETWGIHTFSPSSRLQRPMTCLTCLGIPARYSL